MMADVSSTKSLGSTLALLCSLHLFHQPFFSTTVQFPLSLTFLYEILKRKICILQEPNRGPYWVFRNGNHDNDSIPS